MKKLLALGGAVAGLAVGTAVGFSMFVQNALVSRDFQISEGMGKLISGTKNDETDAKAEVVNKSQWLDDWGMEKHELVNADGNRLQGYLLRPKKESDVYVFASHGYRSGGIGEWCRYAPFYVEEMGYNLFFVDHQAAGESEGRTIGFGSFESRDALQWLDYLIESFGEDIKIFLHGISMGSATVMLMTGSERLPANVRFTVADCGYTSAIDEFAYKLDSWKFPQKPLLPMACFINEKRAGYDFKADTDALSAVARAKIPMLFIHGDKDDFVPTYMVYLLYHDCPTEKDLLIVEGADHAQSYEINPTEYQQRVRAFAEKYL